MATTVDSTQETVSLIGSDKVEGTAVYGADDRKIGSVQRVMIDKMSGKVAYAVISFGGFLGMGEDYYPLPWPNLKYDANLGGYRVGITQDQLKDAPKYNRNTDWDFFIENTGFVYFRFSSKCRAAAGYWPTLFLKRKAVSYFRKTLSITRFIRRLIRVHSRPKETAYRR